MLLPLFCPLLLDRAKKIFRFATLPAPNSKIVVLSLKFMMFDCCFDYQKQLQLMIEQQ